MYYTKKSRLLRVVLYISYIFKCKGKWPKRRNRDFGAISMRFTHLLSRVSMATNIFFENTLYQRTIEIIITLIEIYLNFKFFNFKIGLNMAFVALSLCRKLPRMNAKSLTRGKHNVHKKSYREYYKCYCPDSRI